MLAFLMGAGDDTGSSRLVDFRFRPRLIDTSDSGLVSACDLLFEIFKGVDSSSGAKSASSPKSSAFSKFSDSCLCCLLPKMLGCLILLRAPRTEVVWAGVISRPILLDLARRPSILGCLGRRRTPPSPNTEPSFRGRLYRPVDSASSDSTLSDLWTLPRPRATDRGASLGSATDKPESQVSDLPRSLLDTSTSGLLEALVVSLARD